MSEGVQEFIVTAVLVVLLGVVSSLWRHRKRRRDLGKYHEFTKRFGWQHIERPRNGEVARLMRDEPFTSDGAPEQLASDYCHGTYRGRRACSFEATVPRVSSPGAGDDNTGKSIVVALWAVQLPYSVGDFSLRRTNRVSRTFGGPDDVRIGHPEFDEQFTVRGLQESAAVAALQGSLAEFLLADPRSKDFGLRFIDNEVMAWEKGEQSPDKIEAVLQFLCEIADRLPVPAVVPSVQTSFLATGGGAATAGVGSSPGDELIRHAHAELAATRAPYRIEVSQSRLDVVPDLTDPRWQQVLGEGGQDRVYVWKATCDPQTKRFSVGLRHHRVTVTNSGNSAQGITLSLGGEFAKGSFGHRGSSGADNAAQDPMSDPDFGTALIGRAAAKAGWRS
ncbi:hypothetical protein [Streptomyces sp. NBC_00356]|uniref:hypothetical protein n=1 Tax=Streptomyces sp. NBC_00356 TaxID=2975724 RepID=UPI002E275EF3